MESPTLSSLDYAVIIVMMCISSGIGIYFRFSGNRQATTAEYFNASKSMGSLPVGIALMVSFVSAIAVLGLSADAYSHGTMFAVFYLPSLISTPLVYYLYLPVFYKLQATSVYEYLERRFGKVARVSTSMVIWIQLLLYSGACLYAPALALEVTTGLPKLWSIIALGVVCSFYSSIGGMKAVLMTDVYQAALMFASVIMIIVTAAFNVGGLSEIWRIAEEGGRIEFDNFSVDPTERHTWWSLMFGGLLTLLSLNAVNQIQVQRLMTLRNLESARTALIINVVLYMIFGVATVFSGLAIYSRYYDCDPKSAGVITSNDMLMPLYVMETLSSLPGLPGLFISGIFSAALSTISAALNSLAAMTLEDYMKPLYSNSTGRTLSESSSLIISKLLALTYGFLCIGLAFAAQMIDSILQYSLTINGSIGGTVLGIFTLGMLFESVNEKGAVFGLSSSMILVLWLTFGQPRPTPPELPTSTAGCESNLTTASFQSYMLGSSELNSSTGDSSLLKSNDDTEYFYLYRLSYQWYSAIGFVGCTVLGLAASYVSRLVWSSEKEKQVDPDLFFHMVARRIRRKRQV